MSRLHAPVYASRLRVLGAELSSRLRPGERVLDVGCGGGAMGAWLRDKSGLAGLRVEGLERHPREGAAVPVTGYGGGRMPFDDDAFDAVMLLDVVHHETDPVGLLRECLRVARRCVLLKDHTPGGPGWSLPYRRICLMDWAANAPYGVKCLYDYPSAAGWRDRAAAAGGRVTDERTRLNLYSRPYRWVFTPGLQYLATILPGDGAAA